MTTHPKNNTDLASAHILLFPKLKRYLKGRGLREIVGGAKQHSKRRKGPSSSSKNDVGRSLYVVEGSTLKEVMLNDL